MSSRRAEDVPLDPADVEDIRLRIEAHQRATEMEAASAKAFRSECERAHGVFLRAISRLDEERQVRHAEQLEEMDVTYARARLAGPAVSAELLALRRLARDIARGLAAREAGRGGTRREDDGVVVRPEKDSLKKKNVSDSAAKNASDRFALAAIERAAAEAEARARASYDERVVGDMRSRRVVIQKTHDRETFELAAARGDAERAFFDARNKAASLRSVSNRADGGEVKTKTTVSVAAVTAAARRAVRAARAAARAIAEKSEAAFVETKRAAFVSTRRAFDSIFSSVAVTARGDVDWDTAPTDTRRAAEKARRVERAARASFAKAAEQKHRSEKAFSAQKPFRDARNVLSDERRAGVLVFGPDDAAFGDETANTTTPSRGYTDARVDDDDDGDDGGARATVSSSSSSDETDGGSSDDEDRSVRFAAPSNRHRRASLARARVGEARAAALGARGDDSKGFGVLGEEGVAFADFGPAGRERIKKKRMVSLSSRGDFHRAAAEVSAEADENRDRDERSRRQTGGVSFHERLSPATETFVIPVTVDDGFGLARCRGSGLRLPPPPKALPRVSESPSLSRVIHDRRVAASRARGALTTIREARRGLGEKTWR